MFKALMSKLKESVISVLPVAVIVLIISFTPLADFTWVEQVTFAVCSVFLIIGISLFNLGADLAMTPMGEHVGAGLTKSKKIGVLISVCFVMGVLITVAEPDLSVLADQVQDVMNNMVLIITVGVGVGLFLVLAILKIIFKKNLSALLMFFYMMLFALSALLIDSGKNNFLALSFDSGGVTTGPITVPFIMALGVGIATTIGGRNANENSFGLIAMCSIGPILAVVILALCSNGEISIDSLNSIVQGYVRAEDFNLGAEIGHAILNTIKNVAIALGLVVAFFMILQFTVLKLPKKKMIQIAIGIAYTFFGLVIFLVAVEIGYMPIGFKLGQGLANFHPAVLAGFGFGIGMVVVLAEPAVHVLNKQVEEVTGGGVKKIEMLIALSGAVGVSICLSVIRMIYHFSILYYLVPGYLISLGLSFFVPRIYTAIAFDSGGVASGPLTSSFILPLIVGACVALNGGDPSNILTEAFGVVAMVAMTPLITIQALGFKAVTSAKVRNKIIMKRILQADDEQIIYFK
ncbi:MAG: DUF1538 domain-containing protein [Clostridia bacterium]|nr:DUF1538 domain-containing protein [Clostridia bacterium]